MSLMTVSEHYGEAMEMAGNTSLVVRLSAMYPVILRSLYKACPWPFVKRTSDTVIPVNVGDAFEEISPAIFYAGVTPVPQDGLMSINRAILSLANLSSEPIELDVIHQDEADPRDQPLLIPSTRRGTPRRFIVGPKAKTSSVGGTFWRGTFDVIPNQAFSLVLVGNCVPAEDLSNPNTRPVFEDDEIIIHALYCYCLRHQQDERAFAELQELKSVLSARRAQLKGTSGKQMKMNLSRRSFGQTRGAASFNTSWW